MTDESKFRYHRHLETIATADVEFLKKKDRSYGASWKDNGRSAWFMVRRMIDRLVNMMARPAATGSFNLQNVDDAISALESAHELRQRTVSFAGTHHAMAAHLRHLRDAYLSEDLLGRMEAEKLDGSDGTVTAVLRDLRRYCLLAEAEITERLSLARVEEQKYSYTLDELTETAKSSASDAPWIVDREWRFRNGYGDSGRRDEFNRWWTEHTMNGASSTWRLREYVAGGEPPACVSKMYERLGESGTWLLRIEDCPPHLRSRYPKFSMEVNKFEYDQTYPVWGQSLYGWIEGEEKFRLANEAWSRWE